MTVSDVVRMSLTKSKKTIKCLAEELGIKQQSMYNKLNRNSWTVDDLLRVTAFVNGKVKIHLPDGTNVLLNQTEKRGKTS